MWIYRGFNCLTGNYYKVSIITLLLLAFAMSTDAFAAAVGKGASLKNPRISEALRMGLIFGTVEAITPLIGWLIGRSASPYVDLWDHWIALILLVGLGSHMIYEGLKPSQLGDEKLIKPSMFKVLFTAVGTSIDAMTVGVSLAFINVNIWIASALIGTATCIMVTIGIMLGQALGAVLGTRAEIFGGTTLIGVGGLIFFSHI
ncbi:manganese efflux pump MntP [Vibrio casei]|uniref:manganese efflux pump MntP n=1 Tax=Vibrio casei TaxID=673372 RepID=UPI003F9E52CA